MNSDSERLADATVESRGAGHSRRWTVLFIGDHGKVIGIRYIKAFSLLTIAVLVMSLAAVAVLVIVNRQLHGRTHELRQQLEASHQSIIALREERDMLTAHVVLAETKMKEITAGVRRPPPNRKAEPAAEGKPPEKGAAVEPIASEQTTAPPPIEKEYKPAVELDGGIAVEGFQIKFNADRHTFNLQYKVVNTSQERKPVSGHVILVFKGDDLEPDQWLAMPRVDLPQGRPSGKQKGYSFSISHSKTITQSMPAPKSFPAFTKAVLYVFSGERQLIFAHDYAINIRPSGG
jgi:hypothetical protein